LRPIRWSQFLLNPNDARESASLARVKHLQLSNAIVGAAEPPTKLAVDILAIRTRGFGFEPEGISIGSLRQAAVLLLSSCARRQPDSRKKTPAILPTRQRR
jgi:hypothetical protein